MLLNRKIDRSEYHLNSLKYALALKGGQDGTGRGVDLNLIRHHLCEGWVFHQFGVHFFHHRRVSFHRLQ